MKIARHFLINIVPVTLHIRILDASVLMDDDWDLHSRDYTGHIGAAKIA